MADFREIKDYAEKRAFYEIVTGFFSSGDGFNRMFFTLLSVIIGIFILAWFFGNLCTWDSNNTWNYVKPGDKLYALTEYMNDKDTMWNKMTIYRKFRPIGAADIDKMNIEEWQKRKMKDQLDTTLKLNMDFVALTFTRDSFYKANTACIGEYIGKDSTTTWGADNAKWYSFKPNPKTSSINPKDVGYNPEHYTFADSLYYVMISDVLLTEYPGFKKKK
ncbi:hypothetical protein HH214_04315 [Mucilaginibacter robiniae]|uniref:Uncharacterized protein n=1 Tax=Mucilaginibacter robiniae TaxID=2728022 RepID=A0A7L5DYH2_9SPHI|nr:hypothetical protein [Mucilaginibacter robiniae]QJD95157.1 hypothetical protein HH214_04315 [Mucilaginibacter robiniae]